MSNRMDILTARKDKSGTTRWNKIGVAFQSDNGGWNLTFEALPLQTINDKTGQLECRAMMMVPRERDNAAPAPRLAPPLRNRDDLDDDVPF
jgi:hypothetical protein